MHKAQPKRVLMTADIVGGVWTFALELAEVLGTHGIETVLAAMGGTPSEEQRAAAGRIPNLLLVAGDFKLEWMDDPWPDVEASGGWLLDLEARYRPDLVHLNSFGHGAVPWSSPVLLTAHSCVLSWWEAVKGGPPPARWDRYRETVARSLRAVDVLTAPSRAMLQSIDTNYGPGLPEHRMVVPNGRSEDQFPAAEKESFVLTAGRLWDEAKNAAAVAEIAARVPWPIFLAGDNRGPDGATPSFGGCRMLGRLTADELAGWYARASIYALPARYEPFGLSALEAALAGCALVLGDIPSLREIWRDAALYVPPGDPDRLASAVSALIADPRQRRDMALRATQQARAYTPERMASGYLEAYRVAAESRRVVCVS